MLTAIKNLLFPTQSSFVVSEIDHDQRIAFLEDKALGLRVEVPLLDKPLKDIQVTGPYKVLLKYEDGTSEERKILT